MSRAKLTHFTYEGFRQNMFAVVLGIKTDKHSQYMIHYDAPLFYAYTPSSNMFSAVADYLAFYLETRFNNIGAETK